MSYVRGTLAAVLIQRGAYGRFLSTVGFRKLRVTIPDSRYELLVFDKDWKLVAPANEWYRLRKGVGSPRTRETYLAMLLPFLGYMAERSWPWDAEPHLIRDYTRRFLVDSGCAIQRSILHGWLVKSGSRSAYSPNALALFVAAARDFYAVLIEGEVNAVTGEVHHYYPYDNPMYSEQLLRWKREHLRALANAGAPDRAGIRGERRWYDASAAMPFLKEIGQRLVERHGGQIPAVPPRGHKAHHLKPERYLFQWAGHVISPRTVNRLMWLVLNNIELRDLSGEPFDVTSHLLRHVGITVARHDFGVPFEVAAEMLHHTRSGDGTAPPATQYYSKLPAADAAFVWHEQVHHLMERATTVTLAPIDPAEELAQLLARCDEQTREVFERWHAFHPVVFGHCGRTGLCIRPINRVLCLGCPFLNPRPEYQRRVEHYQAAYTAMATDLEASGNPSEAREHRHLAGRCGKTHP